MASIPNRLALAQLPTPLERAERLSAAWGGPVIWVKRDDLTGFELSGNKVRKLEFHLGAAMESGREAVVTCGAAQSNHCRATALAAARLGLRCVLLLRTPDGAPPPAAQGNLLLDLLAGAEVRYVTPEEYDRRNELMASVADEIGGAHVIPEGASDHLGMWAFVEAMRELDDQLARIAGSRLFVWHAASSGGTTAGLGWAADRLGMDVELVASSVGESADELRGRIEAIWRDATAIYGGSMPQPRLRITDAHVGGGYGVVTRDELQIQVDATRLTGLLFDPTYTGKAIAGLSREIGDGAFGPDDHVVFWHTGGGFALFAADLSEVLGVSS